MKKIIVLIITIFVFVNTNFAQQGLTLFYMDRVLQSQWVNPASDVKYRIHIGGVLVPAFGQVPPPLYFNYANNSFYYNHLFHMGTGDKSDNLVMDIPKFMNSLRKTTHIRLDAQIELLNIGIQLENHFFSFAITEKIKYGLSLPYDFFEFIAHGNKPYMLEDKPLDFSKLNSNFSHYREYAFGIYTKDIIENLNVGGRVKVLFGQANTTTDVNTFSLYTNPDTYHMTMTTDLALRSSMPFYYDYEVFTDSVNFDINKSSLDNITPGNYLFNMRNVGFAFDIGGCYKLNNEIDLYISATDLGLITWNTNPQSFVSKGEFTYKGVELDIFNFDEDIDLHETVIDSINETFRFELQEHNYFTWLPSSVYLGGMYKFHPLLHIGALFRAEFYQKTLLPAFTLSANSNLNNWATAHVSYTIANNYFGNLGVGATAKLGFVNWYIVTDNIIGIIFPQKAKNLNIRMGCNLVFGKEKASAPLL